MIFCVTSVQSVGCTFLDWSIHFVTGQSKFYNTTLGWLPLTSNPLQSINAHGHKKNHPGGFETTKKSVDRLEQLPADLLTSLYPSTLYLDVCASDLDIPIADISDLKNQTAIRQYRDADYNKLLQYAASKTRVIFVDGSKDLSVYYQTIRSNRYALKPGLANSAASIKDEIDHAFFGKDIQSWTDQGLTNIWDLRERRALQLNLVQDKNIIHNCCVDFSFPHYWLDCRSLWFNGSDLIQDIVNWLGLGIDAERFNTWLPIYYNWQKIQTRSLEFQLNYQHIVDCIVNNWAYPIDLTFDEEVIIQHCLIYQHNLNLKTWQLEKFPNNTQELYKLLEHNIHTI